MKSFNMAVKGRWISGCSTTNDWKRTALFLAALLTALYCRPSKGGRGEKVMVFAYSLGCC